MYVCTLLIIIIFHDNGKTSRASGVASYRRRVLVGHFINMLNNIFYILGSGRISPTSIDSTSPPRTPEEGLLPPVHPLLHAQRNNARSGSALPIRRRTLQSDRQRKRASRGQNRRRKIPNRHFRTTHRRLSSRRMGRRKNPAH